MNHTQDDNTILRTWHPKGPNATVEKRTNIMPHHEVLLRLDAIDLERGTALSPSLPPFYPLTNPLTPQAPKSPATEGTSSRTTVST